MMVGVTLRKDPICMQTSTFALCEHVSQLDWRLNFCRNSGQNSKNFGRHSQKYQRYILKQYITVIPGISFHMLNSVLFLHFVWNSFHNKKWSFTKSKSIEFSILIICYMVFLFENIAAWYFFCILLSVWQHVQSLKSAQTLIRKEKVPKIILLPPQCVQFFLLLQTCSALKTIISDIIVANKSCLQSSNLPWLQIRL